MTTVSACADESDRRSLATDNVAIPIINRSMKRRPANTRVQISISSGNICSMEMRRRNNCRRRRQQAEAKFQDDCVLVLNDRVRPPFEAYLTNVS